MYNLSIKIANYLEKRGHLSDEDKEVVAYGLFFLVFNIYCFALCVIVGLFFKLVLEPVVFFFSFLFIKKYAGGYHASKEWMCFVISSLGIIASIIIIHFSMVNVSFINICFDFSIISGVIICILSPLEAQNRPLDEIDAKKYKRLSFIRTLIILIIVIVLHYYKCYLLSASIIAALIFEGSLIVVGYIQKRIRRIYKINTVL